MKQTEQRPHRSRRCKQLWRVVPEAMSGLPDDETDSSFSTAKYAGRFSVFEKKGLVNGI